MKVRRSLLVGLLAREVRSSANFSVACGGFPAADQECVEQSASRLDVNESVLFLMNTSVTLQKRFSFRDAHRHEHLSLGQDHVDCIELCKSHGVFLCHALAERDSCSSSRSLLGIPEHDSDIVKGPSPHLINCSIPLGTLTVLRIVDGANGRCRLH